MAKLTIRLKEKLIEEKNIMTREFFIGRDPDCELVIDNIGVSQFHARIVFIQDHFELIDNDSSNGTFVNNQKVESFRLGEGDEIQIGKFSITFSLRGPMPFLTSKERSETQAQIRSVIGTIQYTPEEIHKIISQSLQGHVSLDDLESQPHLFSQGNEEWLPEPPVDAVVVKQLARKIQVMRFFLILQSVVIVGLFIALFFHMQ